MIRLALAILVFLFGAPGFAHGQNRASGGASAAVPSQVQPPQIGVPTPAPGPGVPRPAVPPTPTAKPEEQLRIVADPATNSLIIYGTTQEFQNIKSILKDLDAVPRQVLLDVLVAEITLSDNQSLGVDYEILRRNPARIFGQKFNSAGAVRSITNFPDPGEDGGLSSFGQGLSGVFGGKEISAFVTALQSDARFKVLSAPSILATDNRPARIQVGTEDPIATSSASQSAGTVGSITTQNTIQYRNTGRIVTIIPQVNSKGLVNLQILAEVSQVRENSVNVGGQDYPAFDNRQAETTAVVQDGDTLVIGGIITDSKSRSRTGIPFLMDIPVIGRFFGTTTDMIDRTELIMLITPHVIRNRDESQAVTEDFKIKLKTIRNELESMRREQEEDLERLRSQAMEQKPALQPPPSEPTSPPLIAPESPAPSPPPPTERGTSLPSDSEPAAPLATVPPASRPQPQAKVAASPPASKPAGEIPERRPKISSLSDTEEIAPKNAVSAGSAESKSQPPATASGESNGRSAETGSAEAVQTDRNRGERQDVKAKDTPQATSAEPPVDQPTRIRIWTVQVASFVQEKDATSLAKKLTEKGYDVYVTSAGVSGKTYHRVQVGELKSRKDAAALQEALKTSEKFDQAFLVVR